ncbi:MAG: homocysteine S-methyltransferase family protein [Clostridiales bacterium]|nr:homocysteine S-methyltransferase family protein [Clostridiales bacterium]
MKDFQDILASKKTLIFDGGMGSMLAQGGARAGAGMANLSHPRLVYDIHRAYLDAGADCLITNTLTLNSAYMEKARQSEILEASLNAAIEQALKAADGRYFVFGDMGPGGQLLAPYGSGDAAAYYAAFCEQAAVFAAAHLSGIIIETVFSLAEAQIMLKACQDAAPALPVLLCMTFAFTKNGGRTMMGDKAIDIATKAAECGAKAVGTNCGDLSLPEQAEIIKTMSQANLPLIAQPNAGKPELIDNQATYSLNPATFAEGMLIIKQAGAQMLGGCCGTTPAHIEALAKAMNAG